MRFILLIIALIQAAAPALLFFNGFDQQSGRAPTPIVPAGYAFTIWGAIYGLSVVFAVLQQFRSLEHPQLPRIGWPAVALFALSTVWLTLARFGPKWGTVPTIVVMLALAASIMITIANTGRPVPRLTRWCAIVLFGLYAGWLTVAAFANFMEVAVDLGFGFFGVGLVVWTIALLAASTALALWLLTKAKGNLFYAGTIVWALVAVIVANQVPGRGSIVGVCLAAAATMVVAALFLALRVRSANAGRPPA